MTFPSAKYFIQRYQTKTLLVGSHTTNLPSLKQDALSKKAPPGLRNNPHHVNFICLVSWNKNLRESIIVDISNRYFPNSRPCIQKYVLGIFEVLFLRDQ